MTLRLEMRLEMTSGFAGATAAEEEEAAADEEAAAGAPMPPLMERRCALRWDRTGIGGSRSMADGSMDGLHESAGSSELSLESGSVEACSSQSQLQQ